MYTIIIRKSSEYNKSLRINNTSILMQHMQGRSHISIGIYAVNPLDSMSTFISGHMRSFSAEAGLQRRHKYVLKLLKPGSYLFGWI